MSAAPNDACASSRAIAMRVRRSVVVLALVVAGCASGPPEDRVDNLPMYGQPALVRPEFWRQADEAFIAGATAEVGGREKASVQWAVEGHRYMNAGNVDFAMRRYDQSWLLDPHGFRPYWGFGRVLLQRDRFDDAIVQLETAERLVDDEPQRAPLIADTGSASSYKARSLPDSAVAERKHWFAAADAQFARSIAIDPTYLPVHRRWAESLYREGDDAAAWEQVRQGRLRNAPQPSPAFLQSLAQRMPEPR